MTFDVACMHRPCALETVCGDATLVVEDEIGLLCVIVDGIGHGDKAHSVASKLVARAGAHPSRDPVRCLQELHQAARGTEGAAGAVLYVERASGALSYSGLGNTVAHVYGTKSQRLVSRDGVLGQRMRSALLQTAQLVHGDVVLLHTDGVSSEFDASRLLHLRVSSAAFLASAIIKQFARKYDDAACIVIKVIS